MSGAQDQIAWVLVSYIVAAEIMTPLTGWLDGRHMIVLRFGQDGVDIAKGPDPIGHFQRPMPYAELAVVGALARLQKLNPTGL